MAEQESSKQEDSSYDQSKQVNYRLRDVAVLIAAMLVAGAAGINAGWYLAMPTRDNAQRAASRHTKPEPPHSVAASAPTAALPQPSDAPADTKIRAADSSIRVIVPHRPAQPQIAAEPPSQPPARSVDTAGTRTEPAEPDLNTGTAFVAPRAERLPAARAGGPYRKKAAPADAGPAQPRTGEQPLRAKEAKSHDKQRRAGSRSERQEARKRAKQREATRRGRRNDAAQNDGRPPRAAAPSTETALRRQPVQEEPRERRREVFVDVESDVDKLETTRESSSSRRREEVSERSRPAGRVLREAQADDEPRHRSPIFGEDVKGPERHRSFFDLF